MSGIPGAGAEDLYETVAGQVQQVGVLPDGFLAPEGATAGGGIEVRGHWRELEHAVSQDGSRILFQADADGGAPDPQQVGKTELYDRIDGSSTVEVSAPAPGAQPSQCETTAGMCAPRPAQFRAASADGSLIYFTSRAALTKDSFTGTEEEQEEEEEAEEAEDGIAPRGDLYRYDLDTGSLTDLTVDANKPADPDGADVLGVVGSSSDGSYVYFVATGGSRQAPKSGHPNLYVWHGTSDSAGSVSFIATLAAPTEGEDEDVETMRAGPAFEYHSDVPDWSSRPTESQAYVTPDGTHLAFMSIEPLTGYDNEDQATGKPDHEVFEYSAQTGRLVCASCDASGARPRGSAFIGATLTERMSSPFHQPRSMSDDGSRLFFSSPDPLVAGIPGGSAKVFEYENGSPQLISGTGPAAMTCSSTPARAVTTSLSEPGRGWYRPTPTNSSMCTTRASTAAYQVRRPSRRVRAAPAKNRCRRHRRSPSRRRRRSAGLRTSHHPNPPSRRASSCLPAPSRGAEGSSSTRSVQPASR